MAAYKLLLADDSVTIQRIVHQTFANEDIEVATVGDGEEAIARIRADPPDVILADIVMPKRTGYEVAAYVRAQADLAHIPVLLLAGAFEPVDHTRARQLGCDSVLVKPFKAHEVIGRVRDMLKSATGIHARGAAGDVLRPVRTGGDPAQKPGAADSHFDPYMDRIGAALTPGSRPARRPTDHADDAEDLSLPTLDDLLAGDELRLPRAGRGLSHTHAHTPPEVQGAPVEPPVHVISSAPPPAFIQSVASPPPPPAPVAAGDDVEVERAPRSVITDAFGALLAVELGEAGAAPVRLTSVHGDQTVTDAMVDEVLRRVLEKLGADSDTVVRDVTTQIVSEVAERLVREEIQRVKEGKK